MGNMLPCLVQQGTKALPAMNPKQRQLISLKLLVKALRKMKKRPAGSSKDKIESKSSSSPLSSSTTADGKGGEELEVTSKANPNPKSAMVRSRLHGRSGHKKGVVRVKVVLTKEEAARLLSLTVGGQKTAAQIVAEIKRMEVGRANAAASVWRPALESIPEES